MEKKEQLWERLAPIVLEREDGFGDITVGGATDQQGKDNLLNFISQELDKAREGGRKNGKPMQGWECPKCGSVYSPLTFECPLCKGSGIKVRTSSTTSGYDNSSYLN